MPSLERLTKGRVFVEDRSGLAVGCGCGLCGRGARERWVHCSYPPWSTTHSEAAAAAALAGAGEGEAGAAGAEEEAAAYPVASGARAAADTETAAGSRTRAAAATVSARPCTEE
jgi:hypothetical protein